MGKLSLLKLAGLALAASLTASAAQALELKYLSSWTPNNKGTWSTEQMFMRLVQEESKGRLTIKRSGPEAVPFVRTAPTGRRWRIRHPHYPRRLSCWHDGHRHGARRHRRRSRQAARNRHLGIRQQALPEVRPHLAGGWSPQGKSGYQIILREAVGPDGTLKAARSGARRPTIPLLKALGASPVVLAPTDVYTSLEKGVVDGAAWPSVGVVDMKWSEVAKHYVQPFFGVSTLQLFINTNTFNRLSAEDKSAARRRPQDGEDNLDRIRQDGDGGNRTDEKAGMKEPDCRKSSKASSDRCSPKASGPLPSPRIRLRRELPQTGDRQEHGL